MKLHIFFNAADKPANMGISQLIEEGTLETFLSERSSLLPNPEVDGSILTFDVQDAEGTRRGFATVMAVPDNFQNC